MSYRDPKADRQLADALREMRAADRSSARDQHLLARRIIRHADPLLRTRRRAVAWWEYAATWSRALVPIGLSAATLAAVGMIWLIPPRQPAGARAESSGEHAVLLGAVANRIPPHELLDLLVAPVVVDGRAVTPAERSGEGR